MVFSSLEFIFIFLPIFLFLYYIAPYKIKNLIILIGSIIFYAWGSIEYPTYIAYFCMAIVMNYLIGRCMRWNKRLKNMLLIIALSYNLLPLILFKVYIGKVVLPVGISFFTFQNLSYVLDVYFDKSKSEKSLINYGAYISMFPQLIAGPIITYHDISKQLRKRKYSIQRIRAGLKYFVLGLGAKVLIANRIGGLWNDIYMIGYESISTPLAWMGIIAYCLQLYFDFWGYSLMAIGMGRMLGFFFPINFDAPYRSVSMSEFYRRWHMTLGNWFKEYVYFPLGGSRCAKGRTVFNLFVVWLLTALWHGIDWNFILWGLGICFLIVNEKLWLGKWLQKYRVVGHVYVLSVVPIMWLTFVMTEWNDYVIYLTKLFPFIGEKGSVLFAQDYLKYLQIYWPFFLAGFFFLTGTSEKLLKKYHNHIVVKVFMVLIFGLSVYCMYRGMNDPFLYFRF